MTIEQPSLDIVNLDEVQLETIKVAIREYKDVDILDNEGQPIVEDGTPLKRREAYVRIAHILNFVPLPIYHQAMVLKDQLESSDNGQKIEIMTDLVLQIWQLSEPFMTKKRLDAGIDFNVLGALFGRFFALNRLQNAKALNGGNTTNDTTPLPAKSTRPSTKQQSGTKK
jgi:hypothetical protein